jgi:uncharacterized protein YecE (DUF72 family)
LTNARREGEDFVKIIRVGTSGYSYREWKPAFYPQELATDQMFAYYAKKFPAVEINGSFYRPPSEKMVADWSAQSPDSFQLSFKAPQLITHIKRLRGVEKPLAQFVSTVSKLKQRLGAVLFQLPPNFKADFSLLRDFLDGLPKVNCAFEFRHASWFSGQTLQLLAERNISLCHNDADVEDCPFEVTAPWGYVRLRRVTYSPAELKKWSKRISNEKWKECLVYFKHEETASAPELAKRLAALF